MHYRNGREAKNGDICVQLGSHYLEDGKTLVGGLITAVGVLHSAKAGNDYCNGSIAPIQNNVTGACICDCLHIDDVADLLKGAGFDQRPSGK